MHISMKEASVERLVFYDSTQALQKRQNHGDSEELRVPAVRRRDEMNTRQHREFLGQ